MDVAVLVSGCDVSGSKTTLCSQSLKHEGLVRASPKLQLLWGVPGLQ